MYQSDIFCLFSNQSLIIDTEIRKIISLSMITVFFPFIGPPPINAPPLSAPQNNDLREDEEVNDH